MGKVVSLPELCEILDVSPKAVRDMLISPSFPIHEKGHRGKAHLFDTAAVINWLKERERKRASKNVEPSEIDAAKRRVAQAAAEMKELKLQEARGDLIHFGDYEPFIEDQLVTFRIALMVIAAEIRSEFPDASQIGQIARAIEAKIRAILHQLATGLHGVPAEAKAAAR